MILGVLMLNDQPMILLAFVGLLVANQQFWGGFVETKWSGEALDLSPVLLLLVVAFPIGSGNCRNGHLCSLYCDYQNRS